ncbi:glycosyltransferase [Shewanella basaltis]|uniref:glycosyltransferase n=1 Tax=Shewanella basaltis TaxID=472183 RepID=UPI0020100C12|nr:glycosyltransferase [Shewanella basaltis]MCL1113609.1 glycosyltransferase [Shewanella basaltis]
MRIVILSSCYPPLIRGGAEISTKALAEGFYQAGNDVLSISFDKKESSDIIDGVNVLRLKPDKSYSIFYNDVNVVDKFLWRIREEYNSILASQLLDKILSFKPDVVITSTIEDVSTYLWRMLRQNKIKSVVVLRSYYLMCLNGALFVDGKNCNESRCRKCRIFNVNKKKMSQYPDAVVGISSFVLNEHLKHGYFNSSLKAIIPNICFDSEMVVKFNSDVGLVKNFNRDLITLGYLGRIHPTKGIDELIKAISKSTNCNLKLLIAGDGEVEYIEKLISLATDKKVDIEFLGYVESNSFIQSVDYLVVPSVWREPFGRIIIESYINKTPVIACSSGGITELVNESTGFLYNNINELISVLSNLPEPKAFDFKSIYEFESKNIIHKWNNLFNDIGLKRL